MEYELKKLAKDIRVKWREWCYAPGTIQHLENNLRNFEKYANDKGSTVLTEELVNDFYRMIRSRYDDREVANTHLRPVRLLCDACGLHPEELATYDIPASKKASALPERFESLQADYLGRVSKRELAGSTLCGKEGASRRFLVFLGSRIDHIEDLCLDEYDGYLSGRKQELCEGSFARERSNVREFVLYLCENLSMREELRGIIADVGRRPPKTLQRFLNEDESSRLLEAAKAQRCNPRRTLAIVSMLLQYMIRSRDLCALLLDDIDWAQNTITISASKGCNQRVFPLTESIRYILLDYIKNERPNVSYRNIFLTGHYPFRPITWRSGPQHNH